MNLKKLKVKEIKVATRRNTCGGRCGCGVNAGQGA